MIWIGALIGFVIALMADVVNQIVVTTALGAVLGFASVQSGKHRSIVQCLQDQLRTFKEEAQARRSDLYKIELRIAELESAYAAAVRAEPPVPASPAQQPAAEQTSAAPAAPVAFSEPVSPVPVPQPQAEQPPAAPSAPVVFSESELPVPEASPAPLPAQQAQSESAPNTTAAEPPQGALPAKSGVLQHRWPRVDFAASALQNTLKSWILGGNPIVKIGVLILFLGLAFLLRYASENAMLPIELRYAVVAAGGIALLLGGWRWRKRDDSYGLILQGGGVAVLYLVTLAALKTHQLIPAGFALGIMVGVAAFAALLAVLQNSLALAIVAALGGFAAPVLVSTGSGNHIALFSYMTVLNLGIVLIAWFKAWRPLNLVGFVCSFALAGGWAAKHYRDELYSATQPFLLLHFVLYVVITLLFAQRTLRNAPYKESATYGEQVRASAAGVSYVDGTLAFGVPFSAFFLQFLLARPWEYGAAFSALGFGLVYMTLACVSVWRGRQRTLLLNETLLALGVVFGTLAIPLGLEAGWTSAAWAVEAAGAFWIGIRQQRWHARMFAMLLMIGAVGAYSLGLQPGQSSVIDGSAFGAILLAASLCWTYWVMRKYAEQITKQERQARPVVAACGALFIGLIPFLLWRLDWAAPALAVLGTGAVFLGLRIQERTLAYFGWGSQALGGVLFMTTLQANSGGPPLGSGWEGLLATALIGTSMLAGVTALIRDRMRQAASVDAAKSEPMGTAASLSMLAGLVFINLAPLFVMPMRYVLMVWPVTGIATLWWAVRMRHLGALLFALALQLIAGLAYMANANGVRGDAQHLEDVSAFMHTGFWGPSLLAVVALGCARLLHRQSDAQEHAKLDQTLGAIALAWAGVWWGMGWLLELDRVLEANTVPAALVAMAMATIWAARVLATRWQWRQLGLGTLVYLPVLTILAAIAPRDSAYHPLIGWGVLAWPLALVLHVWLLKRQSQWVSGRVEMLPHIGGAWLFVLVAAIELRWQFAQWGTPDSAWNLLGWMIAPVLYLSALSLPTVRTCWPVREYGTPYRLVSAMPVALYLLAWIWVSNAVSAGAAAPLPYVPLLNPLEMAQLAAATALAMWWHSLIARPGFASNWPLACALGGSTLLAMLTGVVLRTSHHWAGVDWTIAALMDSNLVQSALSLTWGSVAIALMLFGNRRAQRWIWLTGAALIAVVVVKLFFVEMAASGTLARIISFIVVGVLLLLVGFFAPLPPRPSTTASPDEELQPV